MSLDEELSKENLRKYSNACLDLAMNIPEQHSKKPFDTIVIPSRGAVPFFLGTIYALEKLQKQYGDDYKAFFDNLAIQSTLSSLMPKGVEISRNPRDKDIRVLLIPFTADLNLKGFDKTLTDKDETEYTTRTRKYWANVTAAFFKSPEERNKDPYFKSFTDVVLDKVENRPELAELYGGFPKINKFAMIDTVISGRASNEILREFDSLSEWEGNENLKPFAFLIIDKDGRALESKVHRHYLNYLNMKEANNLVKRYKIPNIVSEDKGPSLLGVAATLYPSIMRESLKNIRIVQEGLEKEFFVGAGSWHISTGNEEEHLKTFQRFMNVIYRGIDFGYNQMLEEEDTDKTQMHLNNFLNSRIELIDHMTYNKSSSCDRFNKTTFYKLRDLVSQNSYTAHSGVDHVVLDEKVTADVISRLVNLPKVYRRFMPKAK